MRERLVSWQWQGYPTFHRRRATLWNHLLAVPAFVACTLLLVASLAALRPAAAALAALGAVVSFAAQGLAHAREPAPPIPFAGLSDAVTRILLEQFFTFPRFVVTGGWLRALRDAAP